MKEYILYIKPLPKPRMTQKDKWLSNPNYKPNNQTLINRQNKLFEYWNYKHNLKILCQEINYQITPVLENITFYIQMPNSWSKKKKEKMNNTPHQNKPDLDNLLKAFKDCLCENDNFVYQYNNIKKLWNYENKIVILQK
jgi:Holliday junction resolvase RusA-like endonuclease